MGFYLSVRLSVCPTVIRCRNGCIYRQTFLSPHIYESPAVSVRQRGYDEIAFFSTSIAVYLGNSIRDMLAVTVDYKWEIIYTPGRTVSFSMTLNDLERRDPRRPVLGSISILSPQRVLVRDIEKPTYSRMTHCLSTVDNSAV